MPSYHYTYKISNNKEMLYIKCFKNKYSVSYKFFKINFSFEFLMLEINRYIYYSRKKLQI